MSSCDEDSCSDGEWARLREAVSGAPVQPTEEGPQRQRRRLSKHTPTTGGVCASEQVGTQTFLARKLAELLDSRYDTSAVVVRPSDEIDPGKVKQGTIHDGGVRLLCTSEQPISVKEESNHTTVSRNPPSSSDSEDSEEERLLAAAVDPHTLTPSHPGRVS